MHVQRTHPVVVRRARAIPTVASRLAATLIGVLVVTVALVLAVAVHGRAAAASPAATQPDRCDAVSAILTKASAGLLMPSESDYPFTPFVWIDAAKRPLSAARMLRLTGHAPATAIEVVDLRSFFRNVARPQPWHDLQQAMDVRKFQRLERALERHLTDIRVFRVGTIRIDAYIVGRCGSDLAGLSTVLIET